MVEFCLNNSHFTYNSEFYDQLEGTPMGTPACHMLVMLDLLEYAKERLGFGHPQF